MREALDLNALFSHTGAWRRVRSHAAIVSSASLRACCTAGGRGLGERAAAPMLERWQAQGLHAVDTALTATVAAPGRRARSLCASSCPAARAPPGRRRWSFCALTASAILVGARSFGTLRACMLQRAPAGMLVARCHGSASSALLGGSHGQGAGPAAFLLTWIRLAHPTLAPGCAAAAAADGAAAAADDAAAVRLQKRVTFSGLTVELFEDLDEGPDPPEPDAASFSQLLAPGAAAPAAEQPPPTRAPGGSAAAAAEVAHSAAAAPAASAAGAEQAAAIPPGPPGSKHRERSRDANAGLGPCSPDESATPAGSSETDGWDEDISPFELLPGMPGCDAGDPGPNPPGPGRPAAPRGAPAAAPPSPAPAPASPPRSSAAGSGDAGGARHVVICSAEGAGCAGELRMALAWRTPEQPHPTVHAELTLEPLQARRGAAAFSGAHAACLPATSSG